MIRFKDPLVQMQYEGLRAETCPRSPIPAHPRGGHHLRSVHIRPKGWKRFSRRWSWPVHWRCANCNLDVPRAGQGTLVGGAP